MGALAFHVAELDISKNHLRMKKPAWVFLFIGSSLAYNACSSPADQEETCPDGEHKTIGGGTGFVDNCCPEEHDNGCCTGDGACCWCFPGFCRTVEFIDCVCKADVCADVCEEECLSHGFTHPNAGVNTVCRDCALQASTGACSAVACK
ncbi:Hypothetical protein A7982_11842 [Minicystis rosea]|nr:Hypothetical protein A7982_11842 [Minicystis rosea]